MNIRSLRYILAVAGMVVIVAGMLSAQDAGPKVVMVPVKDSPPVPAGLQAFCLMRPDRMDRHDHCPVIKYGTWTTWAYSPINDKEEEFLQLVTFDPRGAIVKSVKARGARYAHLGWVDTATKTVIITAQSNHQVMIPWSEVGPGPNPPKGIAYRWFPNQKPPTNLVTAPGSNIAVCRGQGPQGQLVGYWDGSHCRSTWAGNDVITTGPYAFLQHSFGGPAWFTGKKVKYAGEIGLIPFNSLNAGPEGGIDMIVCSQGGLIGYVRRNRCMIAGKAHSSTENATVLVGRFSDIL